MDQLSGVESLAPIISELFRQYRILASSEYTTFWKAKQPHHHLLQHYDKIRTEVFSMKDLGPSVMKNQLECYDKVLFQIEADILFMGDPDIVVYDFAFILEYFARSLGQQSSQGLKKHHVHEIVNILYNRISFTDFVSKEYTISDEIASSYKGKLTKKTSIATSLSLENPELIGNKIKDVFGPNSLTSQNQENLDEETPPRSLINLDQPWEKAHFWAIDAHL
jgi:hypothetical protein